MTSVEFKKELENIRKNIIDSINRKLNGLELEFTSLIIFDNSDKNDPELVYTIKKGSIKVQDSMDENYIPLSSVSNEMLLTILEELEQGNYVTFSKEITE